jgi:hypothetical protein
MISEPTTAAQIENLASEYLRLGAQLEQLRDRQQAITDRLRALSFGTHKAGSASVCVQRNRRLSAENVQVAYPVARFPHLYKATLDLTALRKHVAANDLDAFYIDGAPRVVVRGE